MRKFASILLFFLTLNTAGFAYNQTKVSAPLSLSGLANTFNQPHQGLSPNSHDMTMGYAGEDIIKKINLPLELLA